jgi:hypothetical protein
MRKTWKWILGITLVLVVIGALGAVGFAWQTHFGMVSARVPFNGRELGPMYRGDGGQGQPMMKGDQHYRMMGERGRSFGGGFALFGGLVRLAFFGLVLYGVYWLGRRNARIALDPKPVAHVDAPAAPEANPGKSTNES